MTCPVGRRVPLRQVPVRTGHWQGHWQGHGHVIPRRHRPATDSVKVLARRWGMTIFQGYAPDPACVVRLEALTEHTKCSSSQFAAAYFPSCPLACLVLPGLIRRDKILPIPNTAHSSSYCEGTTGVLSHQHGAHIHKPLGGWPILPSHSFGRNGPV